MPPEPDVTAGRYTGGPDGARTNLAVAHFLTLTGLPALPRGRTDGLYIDPRVVRLDGLLWPDQPVNFGATLVTAAAAGAGGGVTGVTGVTTLSPSRSTNE